MGRFTFTGTLRYNTPDKKFSSYRTGISKSGLEYKSLSLFINTDDNNSGTVELMGTKQDEILTKDGDGNDLTVAWGERKDKQIVDSVINYRKNVVAIGEERAEFVSSYDAVEHIWDSIEELKGKLVTVTGQVKKNSYNGKVSDRFIIQNFYTVDDDKKKALTIKEEGYINKGSFDFSEFKENKRILVNAYTKEWMDKEHPNALVPRTYVIDCNKLDFSDEKMVKYFNGRWMPINLKYDKGKLSSGLKSNKYYVMMFDVRYRNGAEEEEFNESMLTDLQKSQIEIGLKTLDDFRPAGRTYGNRIVEYRLVDCDCRGDYANGVVALDDTVEEVEELIYRVTDDDAEGAMNEPVAEKAEEKEKEEEKKEETEEDDDSDIDGLFA